MRSTSENEQKEKDIQETFHRAEPVFFLLTILSPFSEEV